MTKQEFYVHYIEKEVIIMSCENEMQEYIENQTIINIYDDLLKELDIEKTKSKPIKNFFYKIHNKITYKKRKEEYERKYLK